MYENQLAAEKVDAVQNLIEYLGPAPFEVPRLRVVCRLPRLLGAVDTRFFPEETAEEVVVQDGHDQTLAFLERRRDTFFAIQGQDTVHERPPALAVRSWFPLMAIPLAIQGVEGDPETD